MAMNNRVNFCCLGELREALDAWAAEHNLNRSEAARVLLHRAIAGREPYVPPALPNWQVEAWTSLLRGLFGSERLILTADVKALLVEAVTTLNERDAQVLRLRFGLDGPRYTLKEVGSIMGGVNRQRVHQIEQVALARMRGWCKGRGIWDLLRKQLDKETQNDCP